MQYFHIVISVCIFPLPHILSHFIFNAESNCGAHTHTHTHSDILTVDLLDVKATQAHMPLFIFNYFDSSLRLGIIIILIRRSSFFFLFLFVF